MHRTNLWKTATLLNTRYALWVLLLLVGCKEKNIPPEEVPQNGWEKNSLNPVVRKGLPYGSDFYALSDCWVLKENGVYKMWYTSGGAVSPDTVLHSSISYATSADGVHWTKYGQKPVLDVTKSAWDSLGVETASVLIDSAAPAAQRYQMWYSGQSHPTIGYQLGYAYSPDGIQWTKHPGAVLATGRGGEWDNAFLEGPSVLKAGNSYHMWYAGFDSSFNAQHTDGKVSIGYATSLDGITWRKYSDNPVLSTSTGKWDAVYVQDPHVIQYNGRYHMWYGGADGYDHYGQQTGYAWSTDGIHWTKSSNNPVLKRGNPGIWDANTASFPCVILDGNQIKMWYTGKDVDPLPAWPNPYFWEIGYAQKNLPVGQLLD